MKYIIWFSLFSLILQSYLTSLIKIDSLIYPLFLIVNMIVLYKYFNRDNLKFIIYAISFGFLYETLSSNTLFLQPVLFVLTALLIIIIAHRIEISKVNFFLVTPIIITLYRLMSYFIINNIVHIPISNQLLFQSIYSSIIINVIYAYILDYTFKRIANKYKFSMYD